jgi:hypothetical protein
VKEAIVELSKGLSFLSGSGQAGFKFLSVDKDPLKITLKINLDNKRV